MNIARRKKMPKAWAPGHSVCPQIRKKSNQQQRLMETNEVRRNWSHRSIMKDVSRRASMRLYDSFVKTKEAKSPVSFPSKNNYFTWCQGLNRAQFLKARQVINCKWTVSLASRCQFSGSIIRLAPLINFSWTLLLNFCWLISNVI